MQYLRYNEKLKKLAIPLGNAFRGEPWTDEDGTEHRIEDILFVSHRCVCFHSPEQQLPSTVTVTTHEHCRLPTRRLTDGRVKRIRTRKVCS